MQVNGDVFFWATVQSVSPLTVRRDGETAPMGVTPSVLVDPAMLQVGDRVWCQLSHRRALILGVAGGSNVGPWVDIPSMRHTWQPYASFLKLGIRKVPAGAQLTGFIQPTEGSPGTISNGLWLFDIPPEFSPPQSMRIQAIIGREQEPANFRISGGDTEVIKVDGSISSSVRWIQFNTIYPLD